MPEKKVESTTKCSNKEFQTELKRGERQKNQNTHLIQHVHYLKYKTQRKFNIYTKSEDQK